MSCQIGEVHKVLEKENDAGHPNQSLEQLNLTLNQHVLDDEEQINDREDICLQQHDDHHTEEDYLFVEDPETFSKAYSIFS
jgi:hypothetical protein